LLALATPGRFASSSATGSASGEEITPAFLSMAVQQQLTDCLQYYRD